MNFNTGWQIIEEIGQGGQGKVYNVIDYQKFINTFGSVPGTIESLANTSIVGESNLKFIDKFGEAIMDFVKWHDPNNHGALKVLHQPEDAKEFDRAKERIKREIEAMASLDHPNLLKILDADGESKWFVSQYYARGTLATNLDLFRGNISKALNAFRPLVEAVSLIHESNKIHRDIKPQNVFLGSSDNLILGDFGLIFFQDEEHTRMSDTFENVGSTDWMPPWAYRAKTKIEDIRSTFDVFCLGKVLWAMISGQPFLRFWDFRDDEFDLELMFPENRFMRLVNNLLSKCVVRREENCIFKDAEMFL
ncbi:protein kinase, partial [Desulfobacterota bacterium AH_259_B03_O07]|nr:protein kinase [Desulfobacterota bacterium AH_259_B03_O07]